MKDSYASTSTTTGLQALVRQRTAHAYIKLFDRLGLPYVIVSAMSGAMGGSASEEFLAPIDVGEDTFVRCTACDYAANAEAVRVPVPAAIPFDGLPAAQVVDTPDTPTIQTLVDHLNAAPGVRPARRARTVPGRPADTLKNVIVKLRHPDGTLRAAGDRRARRPRGRHQAARGAGRPGRGRRRSTRRTSPRTRRSSRATSGRARSGLDGSSGIRFLVDPRIVDGTRWVTGADQPGKHVIDLVYGRDFTADGMIEAAEVARRRRVPELRRLAGDRPRHRDRPHLPARPQVRRGARTDGARPERQAGHRRRWVPTASACHAAVAAIAEATHDELGLCWPREIAPADVHIVIAGKEGGPQRPRGRGARGASWRRPASGCCSTTATACRPA